jgi:DNA-binding response OmpR family regulator
MKPGACSSCRPLIGLLYGSTVKLSNGKSVLPQSVITVIVNMIVFAIQLLELEGLTVMWHLRAEADASVIPVITVTAW